MRECREPALLQVWVARDRELGRAVERLAERQVAGAQRVVANSTVPPAISISRVGRWSVSVPVALASWRCETGRPRARGRRWRRSRRPRSSSAARRRGPGGGGASGGIVGRSSGSNAAAPTAWRWFNRLRLRSGSHDWLGARHPRSPPPRDGGAVKRRQGTSQPEAWSTCACQRSRGAARARRCPMPSPRTGTRNERESKATASLCGRRLSTRSAKPVCTATRNPRRPDDPGPAVDAPLGASNDAIRGVLARAARLHAVEVHHLPCSFRITTTCSSAFGMPGSWPPS